MGGEGGKNLPVSKAKPGFNEEIRQCFLPSFPSLPHAITVSPGLINQKEENEGQGEREERELCVVKQSCTSHSKFCIGT